MPETNVVKLSELEGAKRIDAEYYQPELELIKKKLDGVTQPLKELITMIKHPAEIKRIYQEDGVPYILAENIRQSFWILQFDEKRFISKKTAARIPQNKLEVGDVIVTRTGANYGNASVYLGRPYPAYASAHIIIIRPYAVAGEYLATYLNTCYGRKLVKRGVYGTSQPEISPEYLKTLPIVRLSFENEIVGIIRKAYELKKQAQSLYSQAEDYLLDELDIKDFIMKHDLFYTSNLFQTINAHRLDAEYYQVKYKKLREIIRNYSGGYKKLTDIAICSKEIIDPRANPERDFEYIELADINHTIGVIENAKLIKGKDAPSRARMLLQSGDIIASSVEGSLEKVASVSEEYDGAIGSTGFFVLRPQNVSNGYLLTLVKSIIVRDQMHCEASGTILAAVPASSLKNIIVPNLRLETQDRISSLVNQSHAARREAKMLLEKAKRAVEIAIEHSEQQAIDFLNE